MSATSAAKSRTGCPVARSQTIVGDRWIVLILRELFMGNHRFEHIQAQTEATPQMLASRLKKLETDGLIERRPYSERPLRYEYFLTEMGLAFHPVLLALRSWGETWCKAKEEGIAINYTHALCGHDPGLGPACQHCGEVLRRAELVAALSNAYAAERETRWASFKSERA